MKKGRLFKYLAAASGYTGIGLLLGYMLSDKLNDNPLWFGAPLLLLGAILLGMSISSRDIPTSTSSATETKITTELNKPTPRDQPDTAELRR